MSVITAQTTSLRELDHPPNSGVAVASFGNQDRERPLVSVSDARSGDFFALLAESTEAPDAFHDPDGYAARKGSPAPPALRPTSPSQPSHLRSN